MPNPTQSPPRWRVLTSPLLAAGALFLAWWHWRAWSLLVGLILTTAVLLWALLAPRHWAVVQRALDRFARLVASAVSFLLLGLLFLLCFIPGRLLLVVLRRDPLHRRWEPKSASYWQTLPVTPAAERWRRQF